MSSAARLSSRAPFRVIVKDETGTAGIMRTRDVTDRDGDQAGVAPSGKVGSVFGDTETGSGCYFHSGEETGRRFSQTVEGWT